MIYCTMPSFLKFVWCHKHGNGERAEIKYSLLVDRVIYCICLLHTVNRPIKLLRRGGIFFNIPHELLACFVVCFPIVLTSPCPRVNKDRYFVVPTY